MTLKLPLITAADLRDRTDKKTARGKGRTMAKERDKQRLVRILKAAEEQGGLLTIAELSVILNKSYELTRRYDTRAAARPTRKKSSSCMSKEWNRRTLPARPATA